MKLTQTHFVSLLFNYREFFNGIDAIFIDPSNKVAIMKHVCNISLTIKFYWDIDISISVHIIEAHLSYLIITYIYHQGQRLGNGKIHLTIPGLTKYNSHWWKYVCCCVLHLAFLMAHLILQHICLFIWT